MKCTDFLNKAKKWFHSYLTNRLFCVSLDNVFSEAETINCRVLQGSMSALLLLLLYINYISEALSDSHAYILYAEDNDIFVST